MNSSESRRHVGRKLLSVASRAGAGLVYLLLDSLGFLELKLPFRRYLDEQHKKELFVQSSKYGDDGDRVAYAIGYLGLPSEVIIEVIDSWKSLPSEIRRFMNDKIPTATATVVADEITNSRTRVYALQYPRLLWVHAHTNALFTFPWMRFIEKGDRRLQKMADLRFSEDPPHIDGEMLDLYYPEHNPVHEDYYSKRRYVREGFKFFAEHFGKQMNNMNFLDMSRVSEQSTAASVTIQYSGILGNLRVNAGDTFIFFDSAEVSLYCFSAEDNSKILGPRVADGPLSLGMIAMKKFRDRHSDLNNSGKLSLGEQGYLKIDDIFSSDPEFTRYLRRYGIDDHKKYFSINPNERTFAWKEYQTVSLKPEQTVRGLGMAKIHDFHPANFQPLSLLKIDPSTVELLVESPEIYTPVRWSQGVLFEVFDEEKNA